MPFLMLFWSAYSGQFPDDVAPGRGLGSFCFDDPTKMSAPTGLAPKTENVPSLPEIVKASKGDLKLLKANKGLPQGGGRGAAGGRWINSCRQIKPQADQKPTGNKPMRSEKMKAPIDLGCETMAGGLLCRLDIPRNWHEVAVLEDIESVML
jgi:hypothetical protein